MQQFVNNKSIDPMIRKGFAGQRASYLSQ